MSGVGVAEGGDKVFVMKVFAEGSIAVAVDSPGYVSGLIPVVVGVADEKGVNIVASRALGIDGIAVGAPRDLPRSLVEKIH